MALRNTFNKFVEVRPVSGRINQREFTVTANTTINKGDFVSLSSGALIQTMAANATANGANAAYANTEILGVALADIVMGATAEATTGRTTIPVAIADENLEIALRTYNSTAGDSEPQDLTTGAFYELVRWTSSPNTITWYAAGTATTNHCLALVEKSADSAAGDDYGINWYRIIASRRTLSV